MIIKRITAHILNKLIIFIPSMILLGVIALVISPNYFIFGKDDSGWLIFYLYRYMIFLPNVFLDLIKSPFEFLGIIKIIFPALICLVIIEILTITLIKRDIGMKIMGLKIISINNEPLTLRQIILRTIIKYLSLVFFPIAFAYIYFNKEKVTLHDKISHTKVIKIKR